MFIGQIRAWDDSNEVSRYTAILSSCLSSHGICYKHVRTTRRDKAPMNSTDMQNGTAAPDHAIKAHREFGYSPHSLLTSALQKYEPLYPRRQKSHYRFNT
jgi:hypothetical protein